MYVSRVCVCHVGVWVCLPAYVSECMACVCEFTSVFVVCVVCVRVCARMSRVCMCVCACVCVHV